jgi:formylglycine-generating enzyme required for sulfatase activity
MHPTRNLTILQTDIVDFTGKTSRKTREAMNRMLENHKGLVLPILESRGGRLIKTMGDAFLMVYDSPTDAVLAGVQVQRLLREYNAGKPSDSDDRLDLRIGINAGEVSLRDNDIFGEAVNITARINAIAEAGEVFFTEAVYLAMNKAEIPSTEIGLQKLKGIDNKIRVYKVGSETPVPIPKSRPSQSWMLIALALLIVLLATWSAYQSRRQSPSLAAERRFTERFKISYPPAPGQSVRIGNEFIVRWIPAGRFIMGTPETEDTKPYRSTNEIQHKVVFHRGFFLCETECTQSQWASVMGTRPSRFRGDQLPVEQVSWSEAVEFCNNLTAKHHREARLPEGWAWRLPTEAEWEYAARAGMEGQRYGALDAIAWYSANTPKITQLVGRKQANAWGLHDMLGNVWEWCSDWYGNYPTGTVAHPTGPDSGSGRVFRGGSHLLDIKDAEKKFRIAHRSAPLVPTYKSNDVGFRPALAQVTTAEPEAGPGEETTKKFTRP